MKSIEEKLSDIANLITNTTLNAKINEIKNKITNIYNLTTTTAFTAVENNIPQKANFDVD